MRYIGRIGAVAVVSILSASGANLEIFVERNAPPAAKQGARELSHFLSINFQHNIPVVHRYDPAGKQQIVVGYSKRVSSLFGKRPSLSSLGDDGYILKPRGDDLLIAGAKPRGTLYGVYNYLREHLCWEWYAIDDPGSSSVRVDRLPLPESDEVHRPRFVYREVFSPEGGDRPYEDFAARLMLNGQLGHRRTTNPELKLRRMLTVRHGWGTDFAEVYNVGVDSPLKESSLDAAKEGVRRYIEEEGYGRPQRRLLSYVNVEHIDGSLHSDSDEDRRFAREHDSEAAPMVELTRRLAEEVSTEYPRLRVTVQAYLWSLKPPVDLILPHNAGVAFAPIELDWAKSIGESAYNRKYYNYLEGWTDVSEHIWYWLYITNFSNFYQPLPTIYPMIRTIKRLAKIPQSDGIFFQDSYLSESGSFSALHAWVYARLLWNPSLNGDRLIRQFCRGYYGKRVAPVIYRYIRLLHDSARGDERNRIFTNSRVNLPYLNARFLIRADRLMARAQRLARASKNPRYIRRVASERLGVDLTMLLNSAQLAKEGGSDWPDRTKKAYLKRLKRVQKTVQMLSLKRFGESNGDLVSIIRMLRHPARSAVDGCERFAKNSECIDFQELGFQLADADLRFDPKASDHRTASISGNAVDPDDDGGGVGIWGIQAAFQTLFSPDSKGKWDIFAWVRILPNGEAGYDRTSTDPAFKAGIEGSDWKTYRLDRFADTRYHLVKLSSTPVPARDVSMSVWLSPPDKENIDDPSAIKRLYVDRLIALRHRGPSNIFRLRCMDLFDRDAVMAYDPRSPRRYVARMNRVEGEESAWAIQVPLQRILPEDERRYKIYASVRLSDEGELPAGNRIALYCGVEGAGVDNRRSVKVEELSTKGYRWIELPGRYTRRDFDDSFPTLWFQIDASTDQPFFVEGFKTEAVDR